MTKNEDIVLIKMEGK